MEADALFASAFQAAKNMLNHRDKNNSRHQADGLFRGHVAFCDGNRLSRQQHRCVSQIIVSGRSVRAVQREDSSAELIAAINAYSVGARRARSRVRMRAIHVQ